MWILPLVWRILHFGGQGVRVRPSAWPHFTFLRAGSACSALGMAAFYIFADRGTGSALGVAAFFYKSIRNDLHMCSMIPVFLVFLRFWESYTLFDSRFCINSNFITYPHWPTVQLHHCQAIPKHLQPYQMTLHFRI